MLPDRNTMDNSLKPEATTCATPYLPCSCKWRYMKTNHVQADSNIDLGITRLLDRLTSERK
jgi:hypothetical protein